MSIEAKTEQKINRSYSSRQMLFRTIKELGPRALIEDFLWLKKNAKSSPGLIPVEIGQVLNHLENQYSGELSFKKVTARVPARLNTLLLDVTGPITSEKIGFYPSAGSLNFAVDIYTRVSVEPRNDSKVVISGEIGPGMTTVRHTVGIMKKALGIEEAGLEINASRARDASPHSGLSTETSLSTATAFAMNHLYGDAIPLDVLHQYLSQNNVEEIPGQTEYGTFMLSFGGVAGLARAEGGIVLMGGLQEIRAHVPLPSDLKVYLFKREVKEHFHPDEEVAALDGRPMSLSDLLFGIEAAESRRTLLARQTAYERIEQVMSSWNGTEEGLYEILRIIGEQTYKYILNEGLGRWPRMDQLKWGDRLPTAEEDWYSFKELRERGIAVAFTSCFGPTSVALVAPDQKQIMENFLVRHGYNDYQVRKPDNKGVQYDVKPK